MRVLVTGAASGIGAAVAARLLAEGAEVTGIACEDGPANRWVRIDLADLDAIDALPLAPCDALVNVLGLPPGPGRAARVLAANFLGVRHLTERVLPFLRPGGAVVSLAAKSGSLWREHLREVRALLALERAEDLPPFIERHGITDLRAYELSKEAVIVWTKVQTSRLQSMGLRANTVSAAAVETPYLEDFTAALGSRVARNLALTGRPGRAEEIAAAMVFLASPESGWIKGVDLAVDGGLTTLHEIEALGL